MVVGSVSDHELVSKCTVIRVSTRYEYICDRFRGLLKRLAGLIDSPPHQSLLRGNMEDLVDKSPQSIDRHRSVQGRIRNPQTEDREYLIL